MERTNLSKRTIGRKHQFGQGMMEYIIIVALIAVAAIGVYNLLGKTVRDQTSAVAFGLAGNAASSTAQSTAAGQDATTAGQQADQKQGLDNFGQNAKDD